MAKILLIDDEVSILQSIGIVLQSDGHEIMALRDSGEAAEAVKSGDYDLIITDIRMTPVDGMQILRLAHEQHPPKPTIVISAYNAKETIQKSFSLGCVAYLTKPFKIQEVQDAVEKALGKK
jgi:DNA-binding NtrC family response regulator